MGYHHPRKFVRLRYSIGPSCFCEEVLQSLIEKLNDVLNHLSNRADSQLQATLLYPCLSLPKFQSCPPSHISNATKAFDNFIRECLDVIIDSPIFPMVLAEGNPS